MRCTMKMDNLPTVISCCFCCFLRAGTVMIALVSFVSTSFSPGFNSSVVYAAGVSHALAMVGLFFAPNVSQAKGAWDMSPVLGSASAASESVVQVALGVVSIMLCAISFLLLLGAICNIPVLIEIYQWGAVVYAVVVSLLFLVLAGFCFFAPPQSYLAGGLLLTLVVCNVLFTTYFVLVVNSLRMSLKFLSSDDLNV